MTEVIVNRPQVGGGLRVCGCRWRVASDDLVFTAWLEFFVRLLILGVLVGALAFEEITEESCAAEFHLNYYLAVAVALFSMTLANLLLLALESAKGSIWDADPDVRRFVTPLVYFNLVLMAGEFCWAAVGTFWVVRSLMATCVKPTGGIVMQDVPLYAISAIVGLTWVGLIAKLLVTCLTFGGRRYGRHKHPDENDRETTIKSKIMSLFFKKTQIGFFQDVATVLSDVFDDESFVPADIASALILMYAKQSGDPIDYDIVVNHKDSRRLRATINEDEPPVERVSRRPLLSSSQSTPLHNVPQPDWDDFTVVKHFMDYAGAAYGYTWFLMRHTLANLCKMYPYVKCCCSGWCCCCPRPDDEPGLVNGDNCIKCNTAAMRAMLPHVLLEDIVHVSFKNSLAEVPYFVALDHKWRKVVISIRGTLSLQDTITDLCAQPMSMGAYDDNLKDFRVHSGMFQVADYVYRELVSNHSLEKAFSHQDTYELVVTGHSLGAGTAVILAFMLRKKYPNLKCYAFSPPGGLLNEAAAAESLKFTVSTVIGKDLVPRLSLHSIKHLKETMKTVLTECMLPKYQILASGASLCCVKDWRRALKETHEKFVRDHEEAVNNSNSNGGNSSSADDARTPILTFGNPGSTGDGYQAISNPLGDGDNISCSGRQERLILPGKIYHLEPLAIEDEEGPRRLRRYALTVKTADDFREVLVSPNMLTDHFPHNVCEVLAAFNTPATI